MFKRKNLLHDSFFDDINGKKLDKYQRKVILNNSKALLVVAGAGSGKTLTIVGKVKYLIEKDGYNEDDILCLSFTNETVNNLKEKISYQVDVFTFHKLALNIIKQNNLSFTIASDSLLEYIVNEYFVSYLVNQKLLIEYFHKKLSYDEIMESNNFIYLKNNIISFIKKIKCNNYQIKDLNLLKRKCFFDEEKIFLIFALEILKIYQEELISNYKIDFDDMIIYAKELLERGRIRKKYRYIIIDEYQDISQIRFNLVKELLQCTHAKLMCVGDDYQAIYGFSGSNINLFINFFKYFPYGVRKDIKNTYRNSYELIQTSIKFIRKNRLQLRKSIKATFFNKYPIVLVYYDDLEKTYEQLLNYLYLEKKKEVLVLARYQNDLKTVKEKDNKSIKIKYLTVHMAKGLECETVIVLKMSNEYLGFPSKIQDNEIFSLMNDEEENILYAEERRLFYVALTRCKDKVYLLVPKKNPSCFIQEIKNRCVELLLNN